MKTTEAIDQILITQDSNDAWKLRAELKQYVKRTGKSKDYLVRKSGIGCAKCGRRGICSAIRRGERKEKTKAIANLYF
jgi:hypothetical protein